MFKSKISKIHAIFLIAGLVLAVFYFMPSAVAGTKIVKWVDAKGVTHYGDRLPNEQAGKSSTEINSQGITLNRNAPADKNDEAQAQANTDAQRKDNILLASYTKADEIDLARDRSLQADQATLQALNGQKEQANAKITRNQKLADDFTKRNKPVPAYLSDELKATQADSNRLDKQIAERKQSMDATKKRFAEEKARFIALKQAKAPDASAAAPAPSKSVEPIAVEKISVDPKPQAAKPAAY